jgi:hypothetical protein
MFVPESSQWLEWRSFRVYSYFRCQATKKSDLWVAGAKEPVHWFLGGRDAVIQQGTSVWVGLPSPPVGCIKFKAFALDDCDVRLYAIFYSRQFHRYPCYKSILILVELDNLWEAKHIYALG